MYKVIEINQNELSEYKGKIVQVISREEREIENSWKEYYAAYPDTHPEWVLVCLVEEEDKK